MKRRDSKAMSWEEWKAFMATSWAIEPDNVMIPAPKRPSAPLILTLPITKLELAGIPCSETVH